MTDGPLAAADVAATFAASFAGLDRVALAVSGGADSVALLLLAAEWAASAPRAPRFSVVTVDHGLRAQSAAEAAFVAAASARLGLAHTTLIWTGDKPAKPGQQATREARYRLLFEHLETEGIPALATAHHRQDQAETLLMRLARGSGLDGLAAIRPARVIDGRKLLRPLLGFSRAELEATLRASRQSWCDDPSNACLDYERVRLRQAAPELAKLGLTAPALALSAARLERARAALDDATWQAAARASPANLAVSPLGLVTLNWRWLLELPEELRLRLLLAIISGVSGSRDNVPLAQLEEHTIGRDWSFPGGLSLGGVLFEARTVRHRADDPELPPARALDIVREIDRQPLPSQPAVAGAVTLWDGRFACVCASPIPREARIAALGIEGVRQLDSAGHPRPAVSWRALRALPGLWAADRLLAAPLLGFFDAIEPTALNWRLRNCKLWRLADRAAGSQPI